MLLYLTRMEDALTPAAEATYKKAQFNYALCCSYSEVSALIDTIVTDVDGT